MPARRFTYIEVSLDDIALANRLAHEVLGRSLDELAPQTRRLLGFLTEMVTEVARGDDIERYDVRFSRRQVREHCGWSDFQVRTHLDRLVEMEYVLVHRGGRGQSFVYELLWDSSTENGAPRLVGLVDVESLRQDIRQTRIHNYDYQLRGFKHRHRGPIEPPSRAQRGWVAIG